MVNVLRNHADLRETAVLETDCGHVHVKLGSSRKFKCPKCGHKLKRDWNGALGIFLKALRDIAGLDAQVSVRYVRRTPKVSGLELSEITAGSG